MSEHQLPSDSDEDDKDYVPDGIESDPVSEIESEDDAESSPEDENNENKEETGQTKSVKRSMSRKKTTKRRRSLIKASKEESKEEISKEKQELTEEEEKKRADSLWADFMKETAIIPKSCNSINGSTEKKLPSLQKTEVQEKVKITKIFEFAGEEVKVEKEVLLDSVEARLSLSMADNSSNSAESTSPANRGRGRGSIRRGLSGISSVLGQIGKKAKISTLEKSKLDWDNFKKQENIEEELTTYNRGKDGSVERPDFLQRADLRQFEIEKELRNSSRRSAR